jgi:hypothetical protein
VREMTVWTAWTHGLRLAIVVLFVTGAVAQTQYSVQDLGTLGGRIAGLIGVARRFGASAPSPETNLPCLDCH